MNIEDRLRDIIREQYGTIREFSAKCGLPNSTVSSVLSRGIGTATLSNILKICNTLHISADALANNEIEYISNTTNAEEEVHDVNVILTNAKRQLLNNHLMFNGKPADEESIQSILDAMEIGMEIARRKSEKK